MAVVAASAALVVRHGRRVLPGTAVLLVAGWSFMDSHRPREVVTMLGLVAGFSVLVWAARVRVP